MAFIKGGLTADEVTDSMDPNHRRLPISTGRQTPRADRPRSESVARFAEIEPGAEVADFQVLREIGRSGTGVVLEARQRGRDRLVALRVLSPRWIDSPPAVARFREEAALAARLVHPGIVPVLSAGTAGRLEFYAMALAAGPTLAQFIEGAVGERGEHFFREAALRFAGLARTVEALHRSGILHRKIQPRSIFLEGDRFLLSDFALAEELSTTPRGEEPGSLPQPLEGGEAGLAGIHAAPEEFVGGAGLDARADVYSLGMCLYELSTGILPFPLVGGADLARLKLTRLPIAPRRLNSEVPLGLEAVIRQATEACPALRHPSAGELARDLERLAERKRGRTRTHQAGKDPEGGPQGGEGGDGTLPDLARIA